MLLQLNSVWGFSFSGRVYIQRATNFPSLIYYIDTHTHTRTGKEH
uniref:Uncharacterized protein n=1 Tax=Anopheles minimus TaxID=112268 RepID=A0A182WP07_9DIPT